jgi:hypothetical protein
VRWNRPGVYGYLYTAFSKEGAIAEYKKNLDRGNTNPSKAKQRELVSIKVDI